MEITWRTTVTVVQVEIMVRGIGKMAPGLEEQRSSAGIKPDEDRSLVRRKRRRDWCNSAVVKYTVKKVSSKGTISFCRHKHH